MPYQSNIDDNVTPAKMPKDTPSNTDLQAAIDPSVFELLKNLHHPNCLIHNPKRFPCDCGVREACIKITKLFQAREQQLLTELLDEAADFGEGYAVPVEVIEAKLKQTNDGGNT